MNHNEIVINQLKAVLPQLQQIQYDLNSQLHDINVVCNKLQIPDTGISITTPITPDKEVINIISSIQNITIDSSKMDLKLIHYFIGTRLGLYDGASLVRR